MTGGFGDRMLQTCTLVSPQWVIHPSRTGDHRAWPSNACVPPSTVCTVGFWKLLFPPHGSWWEWVDGTTELGPAGHLQASPCPAPLPIPHTCGGTGRAVASTPSGRCLCWKPWKLQAHSQRQVQQGHQPRSAVPAAGRKVLCREWAADTGLSGTRDSHMVRGREALGSPRPGLQVGLSQACLWLRERAGVPGGPSTEQRGWRWEPAQCLDEARHRGRGLLTQPHRKGTSKEA